MSDILSDLTHHSNLYLVCKVRW